MSARRVALVSDAAGYVGPNLSRLLAERGHDLVVGDPAPGLADELAAKGATVEVVEGVRDLARAASSERLVQAALDRFGRIDSASAFTGRIVVGRFLRSSVDDLRQAMIGCMEAPYRFLRAVVPVMLEHGDGQVLLFTSAAGARPTPGAPLYSSARAGANMLVRNVAAEVAEHGVQVNAVGTNFMDFPGFHQASGTDDPAKRAKLEQRIPMRRMGTMEELAEFTTVLLDGRSRFQTGQFFSYSGGWST